MYHSDFLEHDCRILMEWTHPFSFDPEELKLTFGAPLKLNRRGRHEGDGDENRLGEVRVPDSWDRYTRRGFLKNRLTQLALHTFMANLTPSRVGMEIVEVPTIGVVCSERRSMMSIS